VKYAVIEQNESEFPVSVMCEMLEVSRSGYYRSRKAVASPQARRSEERTELIREIYTTSRETYGSPKIRQELLSRGIKCARKTVASTMRTHGLVAKKCQRPRLPRDDNRRNYNPAPNLLKRQFDPTKHKINSVWLSDITYIRTRDGILYLAVVMDLRTREIVGWSMKPISDSILVQQALQMALSWRRPNRRLIFHSDQGSQYNSRLLKLYLHDCGIVQSMSRKGNCWDNAPAESFFATLKVEVSELSKPKSKAAAQAAIFEYLAVFYNNQRIHSAIGYQTPASLGRSLAA